MCEVFNKYPLELADCKNQSILGFDLDLATIDGIILNGVTRGFMPEPRKAELETRFRSEMTELKKTHLAEGELEF